MDNLTHSLVGLFLARVGCGRATPRGTGIMVLAANAPDFDAICWFGGPAAYIHWHRNITHSLIGAPFIALISVVMIRFLGRRQIRWMPAFGIALLAVASHLVLDLTNAYGVRLLLPFSGRWFHWDLTSIVDVVIWTVLLLGVIAPWLSGLVSSEIGERKRASGGGWAFVALFLLFAYDYGRYALHERAVAIMDSRIYHGLAPRRAAAFPHENPLLWNGLAELSDSYVIAPIDLRSSFPADSGETFFKPERTPAMVAAMHTEPFQRFLEFIQYPIWVLEPAPDLENAMRVRLVDLRFGTPANPGFLATATITNQDQVVNATFSFGLPRAR